MLHCSVDTRGEKYNVFHGLDFRCLEVGMKPELIDRTIHKQKNSQEDQAWFNWLIRQYEYLCQKVYFYKI